MAFSSPMGDRSHDIRFRSPQSPRDESMAGYPSVTSPLQGIAGPMPPRSNASQNDARANLPRRFTTNALPTMSTLSPLSPLGQQRRQAAEPPDLTSTLEKKKLEYEYLKEQRARFQADMDLFDLQAQRDDSDFSRASSDFSSSHVTGHQSEPTTPPEYRENQNGFPTPLSKPNRFSTSVLSPPSLMTNLSSMVNRPSRAGSQLSSPAAYRSSHHAHSQSMSHIPSKSVPGSRRGSDEEEEEEEYDFNLPGVKKGATRNLNRNSMPTTGYDFRARGSELPNFGSVLEGGVNTTSFLFDDDDDRMKTQKSSSGVRSSFLQMNTADGNFPILVRRGTDGQPTLSASGLDLALSQGEDYDKSARSAQSTPQTNGWGPSSRHRVGMSLPMNTFQAQDGDEMEYNSSGMSSGAQTPTKNSKATARRSMEVKFADTTSPNGTVNGMPPRLTSSYSTNDIPTVRSASNSLSMGTPSSSAANSHAENHLHKHNASMGRIPPGANSNRHSREITTPGEARGGEDRQINFARAGLQANAPPFGPPLNPTTTSTTTQPPVDTASFTPVTSTMSSSQQHSGMFHQSPSAPGTQQNNPNGNQTAMSNLPNQFPPWMGYGMPMMGGYPGPQPWGQPAYQNYAGPFQGNYGPGYNQQRFPDSQTRVMQQRRAQNAEDHPSRLHNATVASLQGHIYEEAKDQHGCRFLQRKLEERDASDIQMIFDEAKGHVVDLMMDPFGNYLCQKLLEHVDDQQRTVLINNAAPELVTIACNQHGTRALQKMIEYVVKEEQIRTITVALDGRVAELIRDLNGNHVIQKILNHFPSQDIQFIINQVAAECVTIGTHRHGCCVIQRCIDHADPMQQYFLISRITENSFVLVQDPYGNYVVQYILDIGESRFSDPVCRCFLGNITSLSKQKFSSNVIEKCIRVAEPAMRQLMIQELLAPTEMERMLKDSYANYVVQTCLDHADPQQQERLIEAIRPLLPAIRSTPYGRRIANKVEQRLNGSAGRTTNSSNRSAAPPANGYNGYFPHDAQALAGAMSNFGINGNNGNTTTSTPPSYTGSASVTPVNSGPAFAMPNASTQYMSQYGQAQQGLASPQNGQAAYQYTSPPSGVVTPPPGMANGLPQVGMISPPNGQGQHSSITSQTMSSPYRGMTSTVSSASGGSQTIPATVNHTRFSSMGSNANGTQAALHRRQMSSTDKPSML